MAVCFESVRARCNQINECAGGIIAVIVSRGAGPTKAQPMAALGLAGVRWALRCNHQVLGPAFRAVLELGAQECQRGGRRQRRGAL
eukprot:1159506-Pelagomonas_calceolata.AAC.6